MNHPWSILHLRYLSLLAKLSHFPGNIDQAASPLWNESFKLQGWIFVFTTLHSRKPKLELPSNHRVLTLLRESFSDIQSAVKRIGRLRLIHYFGMTNSNQVLKPPSHTKILKPGRYDIINNGLWQKVNSLNELDRLYWSCGAQKHAKSNLSSSDKVCST